MLRDSPNGTASKGSQTMPVGVLADAASRATIWSGIITAVATVIAALIALLAGRRLTSQARESLAQDQSMTATTIDETHRRLQRLLNEQTAQGMAEVRISFIFGMMLLIIGLLELVAVLTIGAVSKSAVANSNFSASFAIGIVAVGLYLVRESSRFRQRLIEFVDRTEDERRLEQGISLAREVPEVALRARLLGAISLHLAKLPVEDTVIGELLNRAGDEKTTNSDRGPLRRRWWHRA
jgi:hypothetical protein